MRPFSVRHFPNQVRVRRCSYPVGTQGAANPVPEAVGTLHDVTFQAGTDYVRVSDTSGASRFESRTRGRVGFQADPGVKQGDEITWVDGGGLIYTVQGDATRDGGRSTIFWVDAELNT